MNLSLISRFFKNPFSFTAAVETYDPSYQKFLNELPSFVHYISKNDLFELFRNSGFQYIMPREAWKLIFDNHFNTLYPDPYEGLNNDEILLLTHMFYYQLNFITSYSSKFLIADGCNIEYKLLYNEKSPKNHDHYQEDKIYLEDILLPHEDISLAFANYVKASNSPIPKSVVRQFKKAHDHFLKILDVEKDDEKWIEALKEVDDELFVQQNIEYRLGKDLLNKNLWKLYISYLKKSNPTMMLHTYSKYCRFWLDDIEMKKEYENEAKIHGPISVSWKNAFQFEIYDPDAIRKLHKKMWGIKETALEKLEIKIDAENELYLSNTNMIIQNNLFFHRNILKYVIENAKPLLLYKLALCCKEFYTKKLISIFCYKLVLEDANEKLEGFIFAEQSLKICHGNPIEIDDINPMIVSKSLIVHSKSNRYLVASFLPKIIQCQATYLILQGQNLTYNEFKLLTENAQVTELNFKDVKVYNEFGVNSPLENLLKMVLKVRILDIEGVVITPNTAKIMSQLPFKNKIERFFLHYMSQVPETKDFCIFVKKNFAKNCKFNFNFNTHASEKYDFKNMVQKTFEKLR